MCAPDPNAGRREAARIKNNERTAKFYSDSIKQWNREADFKDNLKTIQGLGRSRARSDFDMYAMQIQGKGLKTKEDAARAFFATQAVPQAGGSKTAGNRKRAQYMAKIAEVDRKTYDLATRGEAMMETGLQRRTQAMIKKERANLGEGPQFGMPTMLPPKDRAGQFMNSLSFGMNIASGFMAFSDKRLKDDITKVGVSPKGYNIFEWTYKARPGERWRGVIAQDVVKQNPMAVGILPSGFLGVYYDALDVNLEAV